MSDITRVGVIGCGLMGSGIAQVAATAGFDTVVRDVGEALLAKGQVAIRRSLDKLVEKGKLDASARDGALGRLSVTTDLGALGSCDLVIEAVTENLEIKNALWRELDALCPPPTIFASNTSSLAIGEMASATSASRPLRGAPFLQPRPPHAAGGGGPRRHDFGGHVRPRGRVRPPGGQGARAGPRPVGVHREPAADPLSPGRDPGPGARRRQHRRHRPWNAARMRASHGPFHPARFRRSRHHGAHRGNHVRGVPGAPLRPSTTAPADGDGRHARPEDRTRVL